METLRNLPNTRKPLPDFVKEFFCKVIQERRSGLMPFMPANEGVPAYGRLQEEGAWDDCWPPIDGMDPKTQNSILKQARAEMKYAVLFEKTETGYSAHVPDLPGCVAAGSTLEETMNLVRGAIRMHLAGFAEDGEAIPEPKTIAEYIFAA